MPIFEGVPLPKALSPRVLAALGFHIVCAQALGYFLWFMFLWFMVMAASSAIMILPGRKP